ncbi:MAG: metallophosphoesterase family protein [Faecousia sp.]
MKVLVFSDSHGYMDGMLAAVEREKPQAMIHLGDMWADGQALGRAAPQVPMYRVAGNCDRYSYEPGQDLTILRTLGGAVCYMTHGHLHGVKQGLLRLSLAAREAGASVALFGHTHCCCCQEQSGVLLVNPGSCGRYGGTYAVLNIENGTVNCEIKKIDL